MVPAIHIIDLTSVISSNYAIGTYPSAKLSTAVTTNTLQHAQVAAPN
jgi:hypothetical protein